MQIVPLLITFFCFSLFLLLDTYEFSLRSLFYIFLGSSILLIPALIDYAFFIENKSASFFSYESQASIGSVAMFYWSMYLAVVWAVLIAVNYAIRVVPALLLRLINVLLGKFYVGKPPKFT